MTLHASRQQLYADMQPLGLTPLWQVLDSLVPSAPLTPCFPAFWDYEAVKPYLMRSGEIITAQEAVRRVLILENPALRGQSAITQSLYAGLQLILPGEVAPPHRHSQSALRFIVEGNGAYTSVEGVRAAMSEGDFVITPSWTWHDHGNDADQPVVWLDGLDIPTIRFFDAGFAQSAPPTHSLAPVTHSGSAAAPSFSYPIARTLDALYSLERAAKLDDWDGYKLAYTNPMTGGSPLPTIAAFMQRLPKGFVGKPHRQTDGVVYSVYQGTGSVRITGVTSLHNFDFKPRDLFVIPSWHDVEFSSTEGATLFGFSDSPIHKALGFHREERKS